MKYSIALVLGFACISTASETASKYDIEIKIEERDKKIDFPIFTVKENEWGEIKTEYCQYQGKVAKEKEGLTLYGKMECDDKKGKTSNYPEMPIFKVKDTGGEVSIEYGDKNEFWKYSAKIKKHP